MKGLVPQRRADFRGAVLVALSTGRLLACLSS